MAKFLPTFLAQLRPAILHFCQRTAAPGTSGNYKGATARTQVRYLGGVGIACIQDNPWVTVGVRRGAWRLQVPSCTGRFSFSTA
jgi:hypothetical protein